MDRWIAKLASRKVKGPFCFLWCA